MNQKQKLVLIDGNAVFHRAYHALPPLTGPSGEATHAAYGFIMMLLKVIAELKPTHLAVAFDMEGPTLRHKVYKEYKAHRKAPPEDLYPQLVPTKDILKKMSIPYFEQQGIEADDILGTICEQYRDVEKIIVTGDLDELQLVDNKTKVYTMKRGFSDTIIYDETAVKSRFGFSVESLVDYKALRGDPSDNIPGVPGVGEKSATELISKYGSLEEIYKNIKMISGTLRKKLEENKDKAYMSKNLVTIIRDLPLKTKLDDMIFGNFDRKVVADIFSKLGFKSLINKIPKFVGPEQGTLFVKDSSTPIKNWTDHTQEEKEIVICAYLLNPARRDLNIRELLFSELQLTDESTENINKLSELLLKELKEKNLINIFKKIEKPLIEILNKMEERGILLDLKYLKKLSIVFTSKLNELEEKIYKLSGMNFNINSPAQLSDVLFGKLQLDAKNTGVKSVKSGLSTAASELQKLRELHPIIDEITAYRELAKLKNTYLDALPKLTDQTGRLHTHFNQTGTTTGRLSSSNPNLQNIPIKSELGADIRRAFVSSPGHLFLSADYSQIELRVAAHLSDDPEMIKIFKSGHDFHAATAALLYGIHESKVTPVMRRAAKTVNFGVLYGVSAFGLSEQSSMSVQESKRFIDNYFLIFKRLAEYIEETKNKARNLGYVETLFGRRRPIPEINSPNPMIRLAAERAAVNMPIQGTATGDIIKMAMIKIDSEMPSLSMLLQVHDELLFEIEDKRIKELSPKIKFIMEGVARLKVPLIVDVKTGKNWNDLSIVSL